MLSGLDADKDTNLRISATVTKVFVDGFFLDLVTYSDTKVYSATITWMAIPFEAGTYNSASLGEWHRGFSGSIKENLIPSPGGQTIPLTPESKAKFDWSLTYPYNGYYPVQDAGQTGKYSLGHPPEAGPSH